MKLRACCGVFSRLSCMVALLTIATSAAVATPIFTVESSATLKAFRLLVFGGGEVDDVRGAALVDVSNPGPVGTISLLDPTGGVPLPNFTTLAFGNNILNGGNSTFTEETQVLINMASAIVTPTGLELFGVGTPVSAITDSALAATVGNLEFNFSLFNITPDPTTGNILATYQLDGIQSVPEPGSWAFLIPAFAGIAFGARQRRRLQS